MEYLNFPNQTYCKKCPAIKNIPTDDFMYINFKSRPCDETNKGIGNSLLEDIYVFECKKYNSTPGYTVCNNEGDTKLSII